MAGPKLSAMDLHPRKSLKEGMTIAIADRLVDANFACVDETKTSVILAAERKHATPHLSAGCYSGLRHAEFRFIRIKHVAP